ncbi:hypothetical protein C2G38_2168721 [Gigaspora rosea]|uniref:Uncharacterized protein n=1 Tax=Gigaspora rosea TaxID=44941 RepID=A0A397VRB8_9GLOM|nr:hypothetical protein C2G38_2168721 [Gigaspora rosea]
MSFRPILNETKEAFFKLFHVEHGPASAYYTYMEDIQLKYENDEEVLSDKAICPHRHDLYYLYKNQLTKEVEEFNTNKKRYAWMQPYIAPTSVDPGQPFILVIITNLMKHCHFLQQASDLPLVIILTSNEIASTFTKALNILKRIIPIGAFNGRGPIIRPEIVITDDCKAEEYHCIMFEIKQPYYYAFSTFYKPCGDSYGTESMKLVWTITLFLLGI